MASTDLPPKKDSPRKTIIISSLQGIRNAQITALKEKRKRDIFMYKAFIRLKSSFSFASAAFSSFIQNDEMGKGAEKAVEKKLNSEKDYVCKSYGEHSSLIADEEEFKEFYKNQFDEVEKLGKRPDLLLFEEKNCPTDFIEDYSNYNEIYT